VVTTQNVRYTLTPAQARYDITRATHNSDVVLLQEMANRRVHVPGFGVWRGPGRARAVPVLWRRSATRLVRARAVLLHRSELCDSCTRYATVARFRTSSGACLRVINVHLVPGIQTRAGYLKISPRARLAAQAVAVIQRLALGAPGCPTLVGGDWNMGYFRDARVRDPRGPVVHMRAAGYLAQWPALPGDRPTRKTCYLDTLWMRQAQVKPLWQQVAGGTFSDHQRVRLAFTLR
jgi:endonuclease/exonuclease/phosphatase family metal-dependent hydrolase